MKWPLKKIGKGQLDTVDKNQRTALHWAASIGAADYVEMLLKMGAKPDLSDVEGKLPLHWAVSVQKSRENDEVRMASLELLKIMLSRFQVKSKMTNLK